MLRNRNICILIIHGIGDQNIYETLDTFTRNLVESLCHTDRSPINLTHNRARLGENMHDFVEVTCLDDPTLTLSVHEYYWAHNMQRMISFNEVMQWLLQASDGAEKFYEENNDLAQQYEPFHGGQFKKRWYLKHMGWFLRGLQALGMVGTSLMPGWLDPVYRLFISKPTELIADYLGDVAIYTSSDMKSKFYEVRERVLSGAVDKLTNLLQEDYEKIIVVGHSLGSVIAYDALNQINLAMNEDEKLASQRDKLTDLVTMGSPLDKVAFFFREHIPKEQYVKHLVLNNVNAFRRKDVAMHVSSHVRVSSKMNDFLTGMRWTNYWDPKDPVSGPLDFYEGVRNVEVDNGDKWGFAHNGYWSNMRIFHEAMDRARLPMVRGDVVEHMISLIEQELLADLQRGEDGVEDLDVPVLPNLEKDTQNS
jgi:hypothetical protein